jgi:hypothetical protein
MVILLEPQSSRNVRGPAQKLKKEPEAVNKQA